MASSGLDAQAVVVVVVVVITIAIGVGCCGQHIENMRALCIVSSGHLPARGFLSCIVELSSSDGVRLGR